MKKFIIISISLFLFAFETSYCQTQAEMNKIAFKDYEKVDEELNKVYKELMMLLKSEEKKSLIKAQKEWIKFRDSHCQFEIFLYDGGSIQPLIKADCLKQQTQNRIYDLKENLEFRKKL